MKTNRQRTQPVKESNRYLHHLFLLFPIMVIFFSGCNQKELERIENEKAELEQQIQTNQENVEDYLDDLNEIENNLRIIKEKENIISEDAASSIEGESKAKDRINEDIQLIGELMEKNRNLIENLNSKIRNSDSRIKGFEQMVERLNQTIEEKEIEINMLRGQLAKMNIQVDFLTARLDTLQQEAQQRKQMLEEQQMQMNTAYFAIGSKKELLENKVIEREGGFLGIGRTNKLKSDANTDFFTRLNITQDKEITIIGEKPEIITVHPPESYELKQDEEEDTSYLVINDPERFWETTKYLVIQIK
ncbi:MAG: hypothetical protein ACLFQS_00640 [Bacteroidales bacterium]